MPRQQKISNGKKYKNKGFTLVELLTVISIILVLSAITLPHFRVGGERFALQRSAHKLAQDLRSAQEMAMSAREFRGEVPRGGYGIHFDRLPGGVNYNVYLFADLNNNGRYDSGENNNNEEYDNGERVEQIVLEKEVRVREVKVNGSPLSKVDIAFRPPDPTILISPGNRDRATIILSLEQDVTQTRTILVNEAGLIAID